MNLNEPIRNTGKPRLPGFDRRKVPVMGPPKQRAPKSKSDVSSSKVSELPWGKNHESLILNSSSNRKSTSSRSTSDTEEDKVIVALTEGRGEARCEVGIAAVNVSRPVLLLCQTSDSQSYNNTLTKLNIFNPHLIIYPATFDTGNENRLIAKIRKHFSSKKLVTIPRKAFNKSNGLDKLYKICIQISFPLLIMIKNRYYALAAASGLLTYLQDNMFIYYASNSIKLEYQTSEGYAIIDIATADRLELVCSNQPAQANRYSSLFGIMNRCLTRVGTRNLRSIILQPLYSSDKIDERLDCVEELIRNPGILLSVQGVLPKLSSVDQLLSLSTLVADDPQSCNNKQLNYLLLLNSVVETIQPLNEALKPAVRPFFIELSELLSHQDFEIIKNMLRETIYESAYFAKGQHAEQQRIWAIKPGLNGLLDLVRKTYSERIEDMREYIKRLGQKYDLPLTLANNNKKGFHIIMALNQNQKKRMKSSDLPPEFIQVFRLANSFTMKTAELVNLTTRIDDILTDLFSLSNIMIHDITVKVKQYAGLFYQLVEGISYLDVLQSLAQASYANGWIRPKFGEYTHVVEGHHPLLNFLCQKTPIPNPVTACDHYSLHIITGPNGAGKSIFIRQVMLLQIMAQTGCFVPAESAIFRTADKMFARISNDDDMESSASSFVLEMNEVDYILSTMTDRSLIIIDELCRSTSLEEGIAIAMSICEFLARSQAFTFVTTHFTLLTKLADLYFNIKVWQLQTIPSGDGNNPKSLKLDFKFKLVEDATTLRGYGIYMVRGIWPQELMETVDELQRRLKKKSEDPSFPSIDKRARLRYDLNCRIQKLKLQNKLSIANLNKLINEYNENMQKLCTNEPLYSQTMIQMLEQSAEANSAEMNHSIFDGSQNQNNSVSERLFLENFPEESDFSNANHIYSKNNSHIPMTNTKATKFSPLATQLTSQNSISASEAKTRMEQIFTPNTKLDVSEEAPSYHSEYGYTDSVLEPEVNVGYNQSQCSLNLTQEALRNEGTDFLAAYRSDMDISGNDSRSQNIFQVQQIQTQDSLSTDGSQLSSRELSQQLERIRQKQDYPAAVDESPFVLPTKPSQQKIIPSSVPESPYITNFASCLQDNARKTSTPIVTKNQVNYRNFGNATGASGVPVSDSSMFNVGVNVAKVTTPKFNLTITGNVRDLDMASVVEDFVSFAEEIQNNDQNVCDNETNVERSEAVKQTHIFPDIKIRDGPIQFSSEEDCSSTADPGVIVKPTLIIPKFQTTEITYTIKESVKATPSKEVTFRQNRDKRMAANQKDESVRRFPHSQIRHFSEANENSTTCQEFTKNQIQKLAENTDADERSFGTIQHINIEASEAQHKKGSKRKFKSKQQISKQKKVSAAMERLMINKILSNAKRKALSRKPSVNIKPRYKLKLKKRSFATTQQVQKPREDILEREACEEMILEEHSKYHKESGVHDIGNICIEKAVETPSPYCIIEDAQKNEQNTDSTSSNFSYSPLVPRTCEASGKEPLIGANIDVSVQANTSRELETPINQPYINHETLDIELEVKNTKVPKVTANNSKVIDSVSYQKCEFEHKLLIRSSQKESSLVADQIFTGPNSNQNISQLNLQKTTKSYDTDFEKSTEIFLCSQDLQTSIHETDTKKVESAQVEDKTPEFGLEHIENQLRKQEQSVLKNVTMNTSELIEVEVTNKDKDDVEYASQLQCRSSDDLHRNESSFSLTNGTRGHTIEEYKETLEKQWKAKKLDENKLQKWNPSPVEKLEVSNIPDGSGQNSDISLEGLQTLLEARPPRQSGKRTMDFDSQKMLYVKKAKETENKNPPASTSNNSLETKEKNCESTSISEASKLRNLDEDFSSSSSEVKMGHLTDIIETTRFYSNPTSEPSLKNLNGSDTSNSATTTELKESSNSATDCQNKTRLTPTKKKVKKFKPPLKKAERLANAIKKSEREESHNVRKMLSKSDSSIGEESKSFPYPSKLSQKAIRKEFLEQDKKFFDFTSSSSDLTKMWEERLKRPPRPTPRQIQQTTCLATIIKTRDGVQVIPAKEKEKKVKKRSLQSSSFQSSNAVNMNIFSDQNADMFDQFIKSDHKDYKKFNFKFGQTDHTENDCGNMFDFKQVNRVSSEYTQSSQSWTFIRKRSDECNSDRQFSEVANLTSVAASATNFSLTPDGFYKHNKSDINSLIKKYQ